MNWSLRYLLLTILVAICGITSSNVPARESSPEMVTIPLNQIWGYNLPETRDVAGIPLPETNLETERRRREVNVEQMRTALMSMKEPLSGFVLPRHIDTHAFRAASAQLVVDARSGEQGRLSRKSFSSSDEITLIFFSLPSNYYVRLKEVERADNQITVRYQNKPHKTAEVTVHFAMIPLGALPAGEYHVEYEQLPMERKYLDEGFKPASTVCRSFSFTVFETPTEQPPAEGAALIPLDRIWAADMPGTKNVRKIESQPQPGRVWRVDDSPLVAQIHRSLKRRLQPGERIGSAFVVTGSDLGALRNAHAVLVNKVERSTTVPSDNELTLVFFSYIFGRYVWIESVEDLGNVIDVKYRFVSHRTGEVTSHFALIPIGRRVEETVEVRITQLPPIDEKRQKSSLTFDSREVVCSSSSFRVQE